MIHTTIELSQCTVEINNDEQAIIFNRANQELFRLAYSEFDQLLEAVARSENFSLTVR